VSFFVLCTCRTLDSVLSILAIAVQIAHDETVELCINFSPQVSMNTPFLTPNPVSTPRLLQQLKWVADPIGYMESAARQYPDIFSAGIIGFGNNLVFVNTPAGVQDILTNDRKTYAALGGLNRILTPLLGDYSVILIEGDRHKRRRQMLMPSFHGDRMRTYSQLICDLTEKTLNQIPVGTVFSARTAMQEVSLQVILQAVYGVVEGERCQQLKTMLATLADVFTSPLSSSLLFFPVLQKDLGAWSPWGKFLRDRQRMDDLIYAEIRDRRTQPQANRVDILSLMMAAKDELGQPMTDQELRDELATLMFAGHETTATALSWALYWIYHYPAIREKLMHELQSADLSDPMSIVKLPYLSAVCNETLRIYPVAMLTFPRVVQEPTELLGCALEPGIAVVGCIYLIHQREDLYPEPHLFKPERFLERQYSPYEFLPFGGGVRRCIGEALAQLELKLVLSTILTRYDLALADTKPEYPRRRGVTLAPANGVKMKMLGKRSA
jgi:cytochrome P450 family 110